VRFSSGLSRLTNIRFVNLTPLSTCCLPASTAYASPSITHQRRAAALSASSWTTNQRRKALRITRLCRHLLLPHPTLTNSGRTTRNQKESPLLRLPSELRNQIYDLVFSDLYFYPTLDHLALPPGVLSVFCEKRSDPSSGRGPVANPTALLRTCRQVHKDAELLLFECAEFNLGEEFAFYHLMTRLTDQQRSAVKNVATSGYSVKEILREMPSFLRSLYPTTHVSHSRSFPAFVSSHTKPWVTPCNPTTKSRSIRIF
jgi:hypothetical protein